MFYLQLSTARRRSSRLIVTPWIYNWTKRAPVYINLDDAGAGDTAEGQPKLISKVQDQENAKHSNWGTTSKEDDEQGCAEQVNTAEGQAKLIIKVQDQGNAIHSNWGTTSNENDEQGCAEQVKSGVRAQNLNLGLQHEKRYYY